MPRKKAKSRMYFTQDTENAIIAYNKSDDRLEKNDPNWTKFLTYKPRASVHH